MKSIESATLDGITMQYLRLLEALGQAVIVTDAVGTIIFWGEAAARLYGRSSAEVLGQSVLDVTPTDTSRSEGGSIMRTIASGNVWSGQFMVRGPAGESFRVDVTDVPIVDPNGAIAGIIGISALPGGPVDLPGVLGEFGRAANSVWPERVEVHCGIDRATVAGSKPHVAQLLSLLLIRYAEAMNVETRVAIRVMRAEEAPVASFLQHSSSDSVYIGIAAANAEQRLSILREARDVTSPSYYARSLVHALGGTLLIGRGTQPYDALHLILPARDLG